MKHLQQHTNDLHRPLVYIQDHTSSHTHAHSYTKKTTLTRGMTPDRLPTVAMS
ncbi:hypothetical protein APL35_gp172 [Apis mellifera filamentous virus]|uniref:hypothetical protein n=1 Tax=Apis mellifera filamentous virus TaxID=1100043 RepID=UPI0006BD9980|nr:hypothetical protein APL35_gp172 [Apis mellifera filamentous virus]